MRSRPLNVAEISHQLASQVFTIRLLLEGLASRAAPVEKEAIGRIQDALSVQLGLLKQMDAIVEGTGA